MGFLSFMKKKPEQKMEFPSKAELEVPPAPAGIEEPVATDVPMPPEEVVEEKPVEEHKIEPEFKPFEEEKQPQHEEAVVQVPKKPIFVKVDTYRILLSEITSSKNVLKNSEASLMRIGDFKNEEDKEYSKFNSQLTDIQRKLITVDSALFE